MKKSIVAIFLLCGLTTFAQETSPSDTSYWKKGGSFNLNFTRVTLNNWVGGGENSLSLSSILKLYANRQKERSSWANSLDISYGLAKVGEREFRKSDDQLIFLSKYSYQLKDNWNFSALADFRSQLAPGYLYTADPTNPEVEIATPISRFLAPGYLLKAVGFEYKKGEFFALISPLTGKSTFVLDEALSDAGAFGVDVGSQYRFELGSLVKAGFKREIMKNVDLSSNINLFSAYNTYGHIDVNWETVVQFKVNDFLSTTFAANLLYDDDISTDAQYKDVLNIGFLYKF